MNVIGRSRFSLATLEGPRPPFYAGVDCLVCGATIPVRRRTVLAIFRVGTETIGAVCDGCVDEETRQRLARLRESAEHREVAR